MKTSGNGPSLPSDNPDEDVDSALFAVVVTGRLAPEDIKFIRQEIAHALKRFRWVDVDFEVEVLS